MTRNNGLAVQIRELRMASFTPQLRTALPNATERLGPRTHKVCLHGESDLLPTERFIDQTGHSRKMTVVQLIEEPRDPVLQHSAPLAIDNALFSPIVGLVHPTDYAKVSAAFSLPWSVPISQKPLTSSMTLTG